MVTNTETKFSATKAASFLGISKHTVLRRWRSGELQPDEVTASGRPIWLLPTLERYRARGAEKTAEILFLDQIAFHTLEAALPLLKAAATTGGAGPSY